MKTWIKLLIGSVLGIIIGFIVPHDNMDLLGNLAWLGEFAIRIGRYVLVPVMVFSLTIAIHELRQDSKFFGLFIKTLPVIVLVSAFVITVGMISVVLFPPGRIPILNMEQAEAITLNTAGNIMEIFPSNMFAAIFNDGVFLLPLCVFAFFMGLGFSYDRNHIKPVVTLFDSLSRIFFHIAGFFSEFLGLLMIVLGAYWAVRYNGILKAEIFRDLVVLLGVLSILLGLVILPLFLYLIKPKINPWRVVYGSISQGMAAFFSGDINFTLPVIFRSMKENLGIRRRANMVTVTMFALFCRAGSAMVASISIIVIINSYSSLDISTGSIFMIGFMSLLFSFLLSAHPGNGAYTVLAVLCLNYGQGFEAGYLILKPLAFYLIAIGTFIDVMICSYASYAVSVSSGFHDEKERLV